VRQRVCLAAGVMDGPTDVMCMPFVGVVRRQIKEIEKRQLYVI